jgi:hypothetical protein
MCGTDTRHPGFVPKTLFRRRIKDHKKCIFRQVLRSLEKLGMAVVEKEWLLDSLGGWEVRPFPAYMVEGIRPAHLLQAGFPAHLTEQA